MFTLLVNFFCSSQVCSSDGHCCILPYIASTLRSCSGCIMVIYCAILLPLPSTPFSLSSSPLLSLLLSHSPCSPPSPPPPPSLPLPPSPLSLSLSPFLSLPSSLYFSFLCPSTFSNLDPLSFPPPPFTLSLITLYHPIISCYATGSAMEETK